MRILDAHTHIGSCGWSGRRSDFATPSESIDFLRGCGVEMAVTAPWQAVLGECERDLDEGNAEALSLHARYPDFIYPGCVLDCRWPKRSLFWLEQFRKEGFRWVGEIVPKALEKEHPLTHSAWDDLFGYAEEHGMVAQLHNTSGTALVAKAHPRLQIIGSHLYPPVMDELAALPNVMLDISGVNGGLFLRSLANARAQFGAARLLFGTDYEGYDPRCFILRVKETFLPEEQPSVFSDNLLRLLQRR